MRDRTEGPLQLAEQFIKRNGGAAPISDVIDYILSKRTYSGKTPRNTVNALLHHSEFIVVSDGICRLRSHAQ